MLFLLDSPVDHVEHPLDFLQRRVLFHRTLFH